MRRQHAMRRLKNWIGLMVEPRRLMALRWFPQYVADWAAFRKLAGKEALRFGDSFPCLSDRTAFTPFDPHYHFQSAWLARKLAGKRPARHADIGSSIGTIAVISAFIPTLFVDYRPLKAQTSGLTPVAGDLLSLPLADQTMASVSCLHVIEHVGLGRYGDRLDPEGSLRAAGELIRILAPGGTLYLSVPVGRERIEFNAQRIFRPDSVESMFAALTLVGFDLVDDDGVYWPRADFSLGNRCEYGCGLFEMIKE